MCNDYTDELLNHYEAFYLMTRSAAVLGTQNSEQFDRDAQMVIDFLGQVYGLRQELIGTAIELILGTMASVGLVSDYRALASSEMLDEQVKDNLIFYEVKGKALEEASRAELRSGIQINDKAAQEIRSSMCFHTFHHVYRPNVRYEHLKGRADTGEVISTLQTAIMQILGIGCEKNLSCAQKLLKRALLWGEKPAAKILGFLWAEEGDRETAAFYEAVYAYLTEAADLSTLLKKSAEGSKAAEYCVLIAAVQLIAIKIGGSHEIDVMFADQMNREEVSFPNKLAWISRYRDGAWMKGYLSAQATKKIGFLP